MPKRTFKRKFNRSFTKKKMPFSRRVFKGSENRGQNGTSKTNQITHLKNPRSLTTRQPIPDNYWTWLTVQGDGYAASGVGSASFSFAINNPVLPFNNTGAGGAFPNPSVANNANNPTGLQNLIYNSSTATGLWQYGRVWRTRVTVTPMVSNTADQIQVAMAPLTGTVNTYSTYAALAASPNSATRDSQMNMAPKDGQLTEDWDIPAIVGIKKQLYDAQAGAYSFQYATVPTSQVFAQVYMTEGTQQNTTGRVVFRIVIQYYIQFFQRIDTLLLT